MSIKSKNMFLYIKSFHLSLLAALCFALTTFVASNSIAQTPVTTDSRIRTLVYNPNEVYELKFYYNYQSFIEFSEDEEIEMISIGEAFAWRLTPAGKRLFIRPLEIAAHTNMTIITNKRTYHFDIKSDQFDGRADENLVYTVRFFYPQVGQPLPIPPQLAVPNVSGRDAPQRPMPKKASIRTPMPTFRVDGDLPAIVDRNPEGAELNFDFSIAGKADNINPKKVYDNGNETYFQFANDNSLIPTISAVDANGVEQNLEYIIRDGYVIVPTIARQFTLRVSGDLICLFNNKLIKSYNR